MSKVLAVVPARSGSKGIPRKNLRDLGGKPLMAHQIESAVAADRVDETIVSTEDEEFANVAREYGATVQFLRPAELAADDVPVIAVFEHAVEFYAERDDRPDLVVGLQPTCPFTSSEKIDEAIGKARETGADSVVSVAEITETHPYRAFSLDGDRLRPFDGITETEPLQRQDRPPAYGLTGAIVVRTPDVLEAWEGSDLALGDDTRAVVQTDEQTLDIDTPFELNVARALLNYDEFDYDS